MRDEGETNGLSFSCFVDILTKKNVKDYVEDEVLNERCSCLRKGKSSSMNPGVLQNFRPMAGNTATFLSITIFAY